VKLPSSRTTIAIAALVVLGTAASACGSDNSTSNATTPAATTPAATTPAATTPAATTPAATTPTAGGATVMTATTDLGTFLVDGNGMTLYLFMSDNAGPSTCEGQCLAAWPALAGPATAGTGADQSLLGTATRADDGTEQVTYNGWPLYYFKSDTAPGDVTGQGAQNAFYVVDATGKAIDDD
jgi:predicted lipoprotein with Yx(FWY)xxD motif